MNIQSQQSRTRAALFVGRRDHRREFTSLLERTGLPAVVFVSGPGGIGKTSLLEAFRDIAEQHGCVFIRLDARHLPANPVLIQQALQPILADSSAGAPDKNAEARRRVLAIDHFEYWAALEGWLRGELLPALPTDTVLVIAGRQRPAAPWRADAGIFPMLAEFILEPLSARESSLYLRRRGLPRDLEQAVSQFARGYPLALAMAANQVLSSPTPSFDGDHPDLIHDLVSWFLRDVEDPLLRRTLLACATVQRLDEPLLQAMLGREDVDQPLAWLTAQPFVERQPGGLVIHDLVRDLIVQHARGRNLKGHHLLIGRALDHLLSGLEGAGLTTVLDAMAAGIHALRHEPFIEKLFPFDDGCFYPDRARRSEWGSLAKEVAKLEGKQSSQWFEYWLARPAHDLFVLRDHHGKPRGLALTLYLRGRDVTTEHPDPAIRALASGLACAPLSMPLADSEEAVLVRFLMAHGSHQVRTPIYARLSAHINGLMLAPGISVYSSVVGADHEWSEISQFANMHLLPDSEYRVGDQGYRINGHDNRQEPPLAWVRNSVMRILGNDPGSRADPPAPVTALADKAAFDTAVADALRAFHDPYRLARSPLLQSKALCHHSGKRQPDHEDLRTLLREVSRDHLAPANTRGQPWRVLTLAHFEPAGNRQLAADALHVSERTFRRYLRDAEAALSNLLWLMETGQCRPPASRLRATGPGSDSTSPAAPVRP